VRPACPGLSPDIVPKRSGWRRPERREASLEELVLPTLRDRLGGGRGGSVKRSGWQTELSGNVTSPDDLASAGHITRAEAGELGEIVARHPMSVTRYYLSLIEWGDPADPIRKMSIPSRGESSSLGLYDTSGERENTKLPGLQHKYRSTALILATNRCATYCRFCFRKRLVGLTSSEILERLSDAAEYVRAHREISNVLLSGGDPLVLPTCAIARVLEMLTDIDHLDFLRIGTRVPVVLPDRIAGDDCLLDLFRRHSRAGRRLYVVTHFNHPREITARSVAAIGALLSAGVVVNNQTVLLRGVNDDATVLATLLRGLVSVGVSPYYVFQCRPVKRVKASFQVPLARGHAVVEGARELLSGHGKRFKYVMSHRSGKIEIVGIMNGEIYLRYHEAKRAEDEGRLFRRPLTRGAGWLDDLGSGARCGDASGDRIDAAVT
jgi:lysine 2,3-aminomutase